MAGRDPTITPVATMVAAGISALAKINTAMTMVLVRLTCGSSRAQRTTGASHRLRIHRPGAQRPLSAVADRPGIFAQSLAANDRMRA
ncbi:MAG TPA: hypothetical protein VII42_15880 [Caulobacteraceae bacterium]